MGKGGMLVVCATPIGNLGDVTLRVLEALRTADVIAAEDTRRTRKLLTRHGISAPLISYHARNEKSRSKQLLLRLQQGETVALVSDAGTPGIADPGHRLIRACIDAGIDIDVLPGPNAALTALVLSGLPADIFTFAGFIPRRTGARKRFFEERLEAGHTFICYESPHRIVASLQDLAAVDPECSVVVARELTKAFQEISRGKAADVADALAGVEPRGEYVVVVAPSRSEDVAVPDGAEIARRVRALENEGVDRKESMRRVAKELGTSRSQVYDALLEESRGGQDSSGR